MRLICVLDTGYQIIRSWDINILDGREVTASYACRQRAHVPENITPSEVFGKAYLGASLYTGILFGINYTRTFLFVAKLLLRRTVILNSMEDTQPQTAFSLPQI